jgi:Na+/H+-translocating membrane pyrophosphatase
LSIVFLLISLWILCEILKKDTGPRNMQDIAEVIREGSEGFFHYSIWNYFQIRIHYSNRVIYNVCNKRHSCLIKISKVF